MKYLYYITKFQEKQGLLPEKHEVKDVARAMAKLPIHIIKRSF
jgi:hypothetical protein